MKVFYHTDLDGKCSAAIVKHYFDKEHAGTQIEFIHINYNMPFPLDSIAEQEDVIIVDYSLPVEEMDALCEITEHVIWIDHHRTAIERFDGHVFPGKSNGSIRGIRETREAGCVLTWEYFFPRDVLPEVVKLAGDYDVWRWAFGERTKFFVAGMYSQDNAPESSLWTRLFGNDALAEMNLDKIVSDGRVIEQYREKWFAGYRKSWSFESEIDGHKCLCMNLSNAGSQMFGDKEKEYPVLLCFAYDGKQYSVSLYSATGVDVGRIAEKFGGGGHPGAAGFQMAPIEFLKLIEMKCSSCDPTCEMECGK
jgi:oligoribonuclease NrnB/cAMP/cGMP phosphodiesterase (DHH superfamily)